MDGLTALFAQLIAGLRALVPPDICPGGWPWAVSALGVAVGLLPTAGVVAVAVMRKRIVALVGGHLVVAAVLCAIASAWRPARLCATRR